MVLMAKLKQKMKEFSPVLFFFLLVVGIVLLVMYLTDSAPWMTGGDSSKQEVSVHIDGSGVRVGPPARERFMASGKTIHRDGLCEEPNAFPREHPLCKHIDTPGKGIRNMMYMGNFDDIWAKFFDEPIPDSKLKPCVIEESVVDGVIVDVKYVTHYTDASKVGQSAVTDIVNKGNEFLDYLRAKHRRFYELYAVGYFAEILWANDGLKFLSDEKLPGFTECELGYCFPVLPGINMDITEAIFDVVFGLHYIGSGVVSPNHVFISVPVSEDRTLQSILDAYPLPE